MKIYLRPKYVILKVRAYSEYSILKNIIITLRFIRNAMRVCTHSSGQSCRDWCGCIITIQCAYYFYFVRPSRNGCAVLYAKHLDELSFASRRTGNGSARIGVPNVSAAAFRTSVRITYTLCVLKFARNKSR